MKSLPILASISLFLVPGAIALNLPMPVWAEVAQNIAPLSHSNHSVHQVARSITVRVLVQDNRGSGTMIAHDGGVYTVLTNAHVLTAGAPYRIETPDGRVYPAEEVLASRVIGLDAALLQFRSDQSYPVAKLADATTMAVGQPVWAAGFPEETGDFLMSSGSLSLLPPQALAEGYQLGYTNEVFPGMSGGPLLNEAGEAIGINGLTAYPILNDSYVFMDGSQPSAAQREEMRRLSWAVPVPVALGQGGRGAGEQGSRGAEAPNPGENPPNPPLSRGGDGDGRGSAMAVPAPNPSLRENPPNPPLSRGGDGDGRSSAMAVPAPEQQLTGVAARVDAVAKRITVRIEGAWGHGSGAIVAKQGNTYYVGTAAHVVNGQESYQVVAPDGSRYPVTEVKTQEAMDLAVVQFTSSQSYSVAKLADYGLQADEKLWVFVSGWPVDGGNRRLLTGGRVFSRERGSLVERYNESLRQSQANPENQGYELVYTNITHKGMSGGAVLDAEGRVIGFHAAADGDALEEVLLGYSFGVPVSTFLGLAKRLGMQQNWLQVETTVSNPLSPQEDAEVRENLFATAKPSADANERDWVNYGNQLWRMFEYEAAAQAFDRAVDLKDNFYQAWYARGLALSDLKHDPLAIASFEKAIEHQPNFYPAWRAKASALSGLTRWSEALVAINRAIAINAQDAVLYWQKGLYLQNLKRYEEAIAAYSKAIEIKAHPFVYNNRGLAYSERGNLEGAIADFNEAIDLNPDLAKAYNNRGVAYFGRGNLEGAIADYNEAIRLNPDDADAYNNRGVAYSKQGNLEGAIADFQIAIDLNPYFAQAYLNRGLAYFSQRNLDKAIADWNEAIRLNPQYALAYNNLGVVYEKQGKLDKAISHLNEAIRLNPEYADAYYNRGRAYSKQGNLDKAISDYQIAIRLNPEYADAYYNRGNAYFSQRNNPQALESFRKAAELYRQQGKQEDYQDALERIRQLESLWRLE